LPTSRPTKGALQTPHWRCFQHERSNVIDQSVQSLSEAENNGLHTMIPFGFAQIGFVASSAVMVICGAVFLSNTQSSSIMDASVPLPVMVGSLMVFGSGVWAISRYTRSFATKDDITELKTDIKELRHEIDGLKKMVRNIEPPVDL